MFSQNSNFQIFFQMKQSGLECGVSYQNINYSLLMYTSYFVLFARFFYNTYLSNEQKKQAGGGSVSSQDLDAKKKK